MLLNLILGYNLDLWYDYVPTFHGVNIATISCLDML
jgi:hypothetical protein